MAVLKKSRRISAKSGSGNRPKKLSRNSGDDFGTKPKYRVKKGGAFDRVESEKKKQELSANKPWPVIVPVGGSLTAYLLDEGEPFATYEHVVGASRNSRGRDVPCIQDGNEPCPICQSEGKLGAYVMYLTAVLPVEKYTKKDGTEVVRHYQKKLIKIKVKMAGQWQRIYEEYGSYRGLVVKLHRDTKLDAISGNQVSVVRKLSEAKIKQYAKASDIKDKDAREFILKSKIDEVFDYEKIFPRPTAKQ